MSLTPTPTPLQQRLIARRYGMFVHFGINTFADQEWTDGTLPASLYSPAAVDTDQWAQTARDAGMRYIIFTAKHHEGFCLWPTPTTDYHVGHSRHTTDVVGKLAESCRRAGLELGLYYSLWDRHEPAYRDDAAYVRYMVAQLTELLTGYGPICELWLDGGWDKPAAAWDIPALYALVRRLQPGCAMATNWTIENPAKAAIPGDPRSHVYPPREQRAGDPIRYFPADFRLGDPHLPGPGDPKVFTHAGQAYYLPFESTVCLNKYWFYNTTDTLVKGVEELAELYRVATAEDNVLILNSPPNREGRMTEANVRRLRELADYLKLGGADAEVAG